MSLAVTNTSHNAPNAPRVFSGYVLARAAIALSILALSIICICNNNYLNPEYFAYSFVGLLSFERLLKLKSNPNNGPLDHVVTVIFLAVIAICLLSGLSIFALSSYELTGISLGAYFLSIFSGSYRRPMQNGQVSTSSHTDDSVSQAPRTTIPSSQNPIERKNQTESSTSEGLAIASPIIYNPFSDDWELIINFRLPEFVNSQTDLYKIDEFGSTWVLKTRKEEACNLLEDLKNKSNMINPIAVPALPPIAIQMQPIPFSTSPIPSPTPTSPENSSVSQLQGPPIEPPKAKGPPGGMPLD